MGNVANGRLRPRVAQLVVMVAVATVASTALRVPAAGAAELAVSGSFTATGTLSTEGCPTFHQVVDGSGDWTSLGPVTLHLDFCTAFVGAEDWPVLGTFEVVSAAGTLTGELGGTVKAGTQTPDGFPFTFDLTITAATGDLSGATGTLVLEGFFGIGAATAHGTVSGTVVTPPATPQTSDDCRHGGWRDLVDDAGQPFRDQGQCIAWITRADPTQC